MRNKGIDYDLVTVAPAVLLHLSDRRKLQIGARIDVLGRNLDKGVGGFISLWVTP